MDRRNKKLGANSNQDFQLFIKIPPKGGQEYEPLFLSNLGTRFCFRGEAITPHVSNPQGYNNHMFKRPYE